MAVLFATFARTFLVQAYQIPTSSMERDLLVGDHILVNKFIFGGGETGGAWLGQRTVRRGDVVVFRSPEDPSRDFIKRCVGLPGDHIEIVDKALRVNGRPIDESAYARHEDPQTYPRLPMLDDAFRLRDNFGPYDVPPGAYFCLGDNRDDSRDSRFWGPVPAANLKGRAWLIYWSYEGEPGEPAGLGEAVWRFVRRAAGLLTHTRWRRCLTIVR